MRTGLMIATGVGAALAVTAVTAAVTGAFTSPEEKIEIAAAADAKESVSCRNVATAETGFDPATTPVPVAGDAGNKQVLKGAAVGAAVGAVAGEVIGGKPGYGAAAGAAAGAAGGHAVKADKQQDADASYEQQRASYEQQKAAYDAALTECLDE